MALLEAQQVSKIFGGLTAVDDVSLVIEKQQISSLIGPNGAGKTTFFNCLTGLYMPEYGDIIFDGESIIGLRPDQIVACGMARTYQNIRLFGGMTALENVLVGEHVKIKASTLGAIFRTPNQRKEEQQAVRRAMDLLDYVGLADKASQISRNSGLWRPAIARNCPGHGQRSKAAVAG
jgi:branched-chain amino acid transport system ATP-binding protein